MNKTKKKHIVLQSYPANWRNQQENTKEKQNQNPTTFPKFFSVRRGPFQFTFPYNVKELEERVESNRDKFRKDHEEFEKKYIFGPTSVSYPFPEKISRMARTKKILLNQPKVNINEKTINSFHNTQKNIRKTRQQFFNNGRKFDPLANYRINNELVRIAKRNGRPLPKPPKIANTKSWKSSRSKRLGKKNKLGINNLGKVTNNKIKKKTKKRNTKKK